MGERVVELVAADGYRLGASWFEPDASALDPRAPVLVVSPAMAVRRAYCAAFARRVAAEGVPVLSYDFRGVGGSRPAKLRGFRATMTDWARLDMAAAIRAARAAHPARKVVLLGHSAGGWLTGLCPDAATLDGLVLVASQDGHWRHWRGLGRLGLWGVWHVALPVATTLVGYAPGRLGLGQDVPKGVAREWARWGRRRDFVGPDADYAKLAMPVLAVRIADDAYAPRDAVEALLARFTNAQLRRRVLEPAELGRPIGHFGYFREDVGGPLWKEMAGEILAMGA